MTEALADEFVDRCEQIALDLRNELELGDQGRLDPRGLAGHWAIDVHSIERFRKTLPEEVRQLTEEDAKSFAAATVFCGTRCLILVNPSQTDPGEALSIAHELAHLELEHEPTWPLFDEAGQRRCWRPNEEAEAEYLAGALLVPRSGIEPVLSRLGRDPTKGAAHFGVGLGLLRRRVLAVWRKTPLWWPPIAPADDGSEKEPPFVLRHLSERSDDGGGSEPAPAGSSAG